jgi:O-antigen/teichoic acid export membrane protein
VSDSEDLTGRKRILVNVVSSWVGQLVFIVSGFIMPRMIDRELGQELLGIWDFCWSIVSYLNLASLGIGSSVNRYVAKYRAAGEIEELRRAVSSVFAIQLVLATIVTIGTTLLYIGLPAMFGRQLGVHLADTRMIVVFLGGSIAVQMAFDAYRGVITGCHRWDLHNGVQAGAYAVTVVCMFVSLLLGGKITSLAVIYFIGTSTGEMVRVFMAFRVCPELKIGVRYLSREHAAKMFVFGSKTLLLAIPPLLIFQTVSLQVAATLGPAALALLMRPTGLARQIDTFLKKFTFVLSPIMGSLDGAGQQSQRGAVFLGASRWCAALAMPAALGLALLGDSLLVLWMGPHYVVPGLMQIIAFGMFLPMAQSPAGQVLVGMNRHGRIGVISLVLVVLMLIGGHSLHLATGYRVQGAALTSVICLIVPYGLLVPAAACRALGIPILQYLRGTFSRPFVAVLPFAATLMACRWLLEGRPAAILIVAISSGAVVLFISYWFLILEARHRDALLKSLKARLA